MADVIQSYKRHYLLVTHKHAHTRIMFFIYTLTSHTITCKALPQPMLSDGDK